MKKGAFTLTLVFVAVCVVSVAQDQQPEIRDPAQLVGKRVVVHRMPLCQPGTYTVDTTHAGKQATVVSAKPNKAMPALPPTAMSRLDPAARAMIEGQQKAATLLLQFDDGTQLDSCGPASPRQLNDYLDLAPGQTLEAPVSQAGESAAPSPVTFAQGSPPPTQNTWLQPSDQQLQLALDSGYKGPKLTYLVFKFNPQKTKIGNDYVDQPGITVSPPLVCAYGLGENARAKLIDKPELPQAKNACYGKVIVIAIHISPSLNANWPLVLERNGQRLQPSSAIPDNNPAVTRYQTFFGEMVGYQYQDRFVFTPPSDWTSNVALTYADDSGKHHTVAIKDGTFEK